MKIRFMAPAIVLAFTAQIASAQDNPPTSQDSSQARSARAPEFRCALRDRSMPDPNRTQTPDPSTRGNDSLARARRDTSFTARTDATRGQLPPVGQSWVDRRLCGALEGITLNDQQQRQIDDIRARHYPVLGGILSDSGITVEQRTSLEAMDTQVRAQLTAEQQPLFDRNIARLNASVISTRRR